MKPVYIMLCISLNTACCEGFFIHSAVKTKIQSRTSIEMLDALLRIKCMFPPEHADPEPGTAAAEGRVSPMGAAAAGNLERGSGIARALHAKAADHAVPTENEG